MVQIVVIACENPQKFSRPITHWTARELADEAIKQGIVKSISPRSVGRFLKGVIASTTSKPLLAESRDRKPKTLQSTNNATFTGRTTGVFLYSPWHSWMRPTQTTMAKPFKWTYTGYPLYDEEFDPREQRTLYGAFVELISEQIAVMLDCRGDIRENILGRDVINEFEFVLNGKGRTVVVNPAISLWRWCTHNRYNFRSNFLTSCRRSPLLIRNVLLI